MKRFGENSSIHGIKYVFEENNLRLSKILWALALFSSFCGFSFYIYSAYVKWQIDPEIVKRTRELNSTEFPAPAITICSPLFAKNDSPNYDKVQINYFKKNPFQISQEDCHRLAANLHWCRPAFSELVDDICKEFDMRDINVVDIMTESSLTVEEGFLFCHIGPCQEQTFKYFTDFGMCYTRNMMSASMIFNTDVIHEDFIKITSNFDNESEPLWTPEKGYKNNEVNYPERAHKYFLRLRPILKEIDSKNPCDSKAFKIFIHNPHEFVTPYHDFVYLTFGEFMDFKIFPHAQRTDVALKDFPADLRKCYFEDERKLKFFKTYTKALCQWECKANLTLATCGCVKFSMPRDKSTKVCNLTELTVCVVDVTEPSCDCYEACADLRFTYKVNKTPVNKDTIANVPDTSTRSEADFAIESETVEEIENFLPYKIQNFISDFGGLLGLFMGCSLLSIIEIFYFIFHSFIELLMSNKKTDKVKNEKEITIAAVMKELKNLNNKIIQIDERVTMEMNQIDEKVEKKIFALKNDVEKLNRNICTLCDFEG